MSSAGIRRTGQGVSRGESSTGSGAVEARGQVPDFWPLPTAASQRGRERQLGRQVGKGKVEGIEA